MAESDLSDFSDFLASVVFPGCAFLAGGASASFGESAAAIPAHRNRVSVSAASFFIASLFYFLIRIE
jgi:hypothetical protein